MKFKDKHTGIIYDNVKDAYDFYCSGQSCRTCGIRKKSALCVSWTRANPLEFAKRAGYEIIEDELTEAIKSDIEQDNETLPPEIPKYNFGEIEKGVNQANQALVNMVDTIASLELDQAIKADKGKYRPTLVPTGIIKAIARVREHGHQKYGDGADKWAEIDKSRYKDALYRHWLAYLDGEEVDTESGLSHLWHMATNLAFIIEMEGKPE